jgi:non-ribosomal peptide synthetase component F
MFVSVVFDISYDYDFHAFINEFSKLSAVDGDQTPELFNGLIDYQKWSTTNRVLVADVSRLTEKDVPQSIQVMGTNAS